MKEVLCKNCGTPLQKDVNREWTHMPLLEDPYIGETRFGCHYYNPAIIQPDVTDDDHYIHAEPPNALPS